MSLERTYLEDTLTEKIKLLLTKTLLVLMVLNAASLGFNLYLTAKVVTGCSTVYGLSISGKVFETYSFSCNNPQIPSVYGVTQSEQ